MTTSCCVDLEKKKTFMELFARESETAETLRMSMAIRLRLIT